MLHDIQVEGKLISSRIRILNIPTEKWKKQNSSWIWEFRKEEFIVSTDTLLSKNTFLIYSRIDKSTREIMIPLVNFQHYYTMAFCIEDCIILRKGSRIYSFSLQSFQIQFIQSHPSLNLQCAVIKPDSLDSSLFVYIQNDNSISSSKKIQLKLFQLFRLR